MYKIIDFHTHIFPDNIAAHALSFLSSKANATAYTDGTLSGLISSMDKAGIKLSVNMPVATKPEQVFSINRWCANLHNPRIISFASWHPQLKDKNGICEIRKAGFKGIKLHPEFQDFSPDDKSLHPLWEDCIENQIIVFFHAGADFAFAPPYKSSPANFANLHRKFPELKMILAHFGSWKMWDELEKYIIGLPIFLETSFTLDYIPHDLFVKLCRKHGTDKIIFGSDSPWEDQSDQIKKFLSMPFTEEEKIKILAENAEKILF